MHRAGARDPPRQDLSPLRHERSEQLHVLVVDVVDFVRAELADLAPGKHRPALSLSFVAGLLVAPAAAAAAAAAARTSLSKWHPKPPSLRSDRRRQYRARLGPGPHRVAAVAGGRVSRGGAQTRSDASCGSVRPPSSLRRRGRLDAARSDPSPGAADPIF